MPNHLFSIAQVAKNSVSEGPLDLGSCLAYYSLALCSSSSHQIVFESTLCSDLLLAPSSSASVSGFLLWFRPAKRNKEVIVCSMLAWIQEGQPNCTAKKIPFIIPPTPHQFLAGAPNALHISTSAFHLANLEDCSIFWLERKGRI